MYSSFKLREQKTLSCFIKHTELKSCTTVVLLLLFESNIHSINLHINLNLRTFDSGNLLSVDFLFYLGLLKSSVQEGWGR